MEEDASARADGRHRSWTDRLALWVFVAYLGVAFVVLLRSNDHLWFLGDDWGLLDERDATTFSGLIKPHNGHPVVLPTLVYGAIYRVVGLHSYLPYMAATTALHLTLAALLRIVMRRSGVGPWIATVVAGTLVLFGAGWENLVLPIETSLVGSMVFGTAQLLLAGHDDRDVRRDAAAVAAGCVAVTSSSAGVGMLLVVGLATVARRGVRAAAVQTVPPAAVYLVWLVATTAQREETGPPPSGIEPVVHWIVDGATGVFVAHAQHPIGAVALAALLAGGLVLAWRPLPWRERRRLAAAPAAMLIGALAMTVLIATQRAGFAERFQAELARSSRYVHMAVALTLPAVAVAADALVRRWRWSTPLVAVVLLMGVPANVRALSSDNPLYEEPFLDRQRRFVTAIAASPLVHDVPPDSYVDPNTFLTANLTTGFLAHAGRIGRVPDPDPGTPAEQDLVATRLRLGQRRTTIDAPPDSCTTYAEPLELRPQFGDRFAFETPVAIQSRSEDGTFGWPVTYSPGLAGNVVRVQVPDVVLKLRPPSPGATFTWCPLG